MIHIEKDQNIPENENLKVFSKTGDYSDFEQIEYYSIDDPEIAIGAFQAQFIKYGGLVYRFNDPRDLGAEILKIDPESTHAAASFVRMNNELLKQMNAGTLEPESLDKVVTQEKAATEEKMEEEVPVEEEEEVPTEETVEEVPEEETETEDDDTTTVIPPDTSVSTTTPPVVIDTSTTTPPVITDTSTTTPPVVTDTSTTTPAVPEPDTSVSTTTPSLPDEPVVPPADTGTSTTTDEIVAFAKRKIVNKFLNL